VIDDRGQGAGSRGQGAGSREQGAGGEKVVLIWYLVKLDNLFCGVL